MSIPPVETPGDLEQEFAHMAEFVTVHDASSSEAKNFWPTVRADAVLDHRDKD